MRTSGSRWNGRARILRTSSWEMVGILVGEGFRFVRSIPPLFKFSVIGTGDVLDIAPDMGGDNIYKEYL
ncbi:hypothetical protein DRN77_03140 [Methanosarcinales archaeon]|nr:MAG: hypothetical protein DRN77_03140 [Methanosarcinales archaeon]